jgi:hypothetical protein
MRVDRTDTIGNEIYIMTENHPYREILPLLRQIESKTLPIKHVGTKHANTIATGYKVPADTSAIDEIIQILKEKTFT